MKAVATIKVRPKANCTSCHGTGLFTDWVPVPFGSGNCAMETFCDCVLDQIDAELPDDIEIELVT